MVDDAMLRLAKDMLGYNDEQWEIWKSNPRNLSVLDRYEDFQRCKVVAEVISAYGCAAGHKVGHRIVFGGDGTLLCNESPKKVCVGLLSPMAPAAWAVLEKITNGEDPTQIAINKVHCADVGVQHGGWGEVVVEMRVEKTRE